MRVPRLNEIEIQSAIAVGADTRQNGLHPIAPLILNASEKELHRALLAFTGNLGADKPMMHRLNYYDMFRSMLGFRESTESLHRFAIASRDWISEINLNLYPIGYFPDEDDTDEYVITIDDQTDLPPQTELAQCPWILPLHPIPEITLTMLTTLGDLVTEGKRMQNCIASYAKRAIAGECFIAHVDMEVPSGKSMATIDLRLTPDGLLKIENVNGWRNRTGLASTWVKSDLPAILTSLSPRNMP